MSTWFQLRGFVEDPGLGLVLGSGCGLVFALEVRAGRSGRRFFVHGLRWHAVGPQESADDRMSWLYYALGMIASVIGRVVTSQGTHRLGATTKRHVNPRSQNRLESRGLISTKKGSVQARSLKEGEVWKLCRRK